jgi:beta-xylosidase
MSDAPRAARWTAACLIAFFVVLGAALGCAGTVPDPGDGTYVNPILHADYSDPDAVRVGDDFWMTSSSFSQVPGLPILHSRDLVNWSLVAHALPRLVPEDAHRTPQHGKGVWAPSIRHHADRFWIYYPDPDTGLYVITATDPRGPWSAPILVKGGKGLIDPCPFWDEDGSVYLVHAWARSFSGIDNVLTLLRLTADGTGVAEDLGVLIDGDALPGTSTLEGPKVYRRDGWTYVFAPAGGVTYGWQSVFRARDIRGPYEGRIVLDQGATDVNGPHQGALVDTPSGEFWFLHFQDKGVYGRVVHLEPVVWKDDWPVIGEDPDGDGTGQPVLAPRRPDLPGQPDATPPTSDAFDAPDLGLQWQWQANPEPAWYSLADAPGRLRLFAQPEPNPGNLYDAPSLLLQKFPAEVFSVTTTIDGTGLAEGESAGLIVFGYDYAWLGLQRIDGVVTLVLADGRGGLLGLPQGETAVALPEGAADRPIRLRVSVREGGLCRFGFSVDGVAFTPADTEDFPASMGRWIGARVGLFAAASAAAGAGHADFAEVVVEPVP